MKWEEFEKQYPQTSSYTNLEETDIDCPICGKKIFKRLDVVFPSYPTQYQYECKCGWVGYTHA